MVFVLAVAIIMMGFVVVTEVVDVEVVVFLSAGSGSRFSRAVVVLILLSFINVVCCVSAYSKLVKLTIHKKVTISSGKQY